jgi:hypothetical protein
VSLRRSLVRRPTNYDSHACFTVFPSNLTLSVFLVLVVTVIVSPAINLSNCMFLLAETVQKFLSNRAEILLRS